jgi:hypothetical protein
MSLKYYMISPLIVPKLKSGLKCTQLNSFNFFYNQKTGEQIIEANTEKGINKNNSQVSIKALLSDGTGKMLLDKLNTSFPEWESVFCEISPIKKEINLIFLNSDGKKIGNLKY